MPDYEIAVEIRVVANGYWVGRASGYRSAETHSKLDEVHVFQTFEALTNYLKNALKPINQELLNDK